MTRSMTFTSSATTAEGQKPCIAYVGNSNYDHPPHQAQ